MSANMGNLSEAGPRERDFVKMDWRRERDSNPRYGFPYTHFPGVRLQPLGHLSVAPVMTADGGFCKRGGRHSADFRNRMKSLPYPPAAPDALGAIFRP